jgi:uncharacterized protein
LPEALGVSEEELALLAVLMLRGPQTPGELKGRSERLHRFEGLPAVQETLERLVEREYVVRHPRQPGQKEDRYEQVLGGGAGDVGVSAPAEPEPREQAPVAAAEISTGGASGDRLDRIERQLESLRVELASLREALGGSD